MTPLLGLRLLFMDAHRKPELSLRYYLAGAASGALMTLAVSALVMMGLGGADSIVIAQHAGPRFIAYAMMVVGGLAGAALTPGVIAARVEARRREAPSNRGEQYYPLAVLGGVAMGLVALGIVLPAASTIERFVKLLLALTFPSVLGLSAWLSLFVTLAGVPLLAYFSARLLDREIRRSRAASPLSAGDVAGKMEHAGPRSVSQLLDMAIRVGFCAVIGAGLALRIVFFTMETFGTTPLHALVYGELTSLPIVWGAAIVAALGGGVLGWRLDEYWRARTPRRRVVPLGAWYGHTPPAWIGGILAAKLLSGVAFGLARLVFLPIEAIAPALGSIRPLMVVHLLAGIAWMLIIGRFVARAIDAVIVRERAMRLPQGKVDRIA